MQSNSFNANYQKNCKVDRILYKYAPLCRHSCFSSALLLRFTDFDHQPLLFQRQIIQGLIRPVTVIFSHPALSWTDKNPEVL
jgi:hypothetical protein